MYKIAGLIEGAAPFLYNKMSQASKEKLNTRAGGGRPQQVDREAEALEKVYRNAAGKLVIPKWMLKQCFLSGIQKAGLKEGRASMRSFAEATVFVEEDPCFGIAEPDAIHEVVGRIPPKTGAAAIIRRPMLHAGWRLPFSLLVVDDRRDSESLRRGMEEAGLLVGIGSWRPEYGRFIVREWQKEAIES